MKENIIANSDEYEIKIGDTVYVISHGYGSADLSDIIAEYLTNKTKAA